MEHFVLVILSVLATGLFFVVVPMAVLMLWFYWKPRAVPCAAAGCPANVRVDAGHASWTAVIGRLNLKVASCSLWPGRRGCDQSCLRDPAFKV